MKSIEIIAPCSGRLVSIEEVQDQVYAERVLYDGFAIVAQGKTFIAPISGKVTVPDHIFHAYAIRNESGLECILHVGINTVLLKGKGFKKFVKSNEHINEGELLCEFDFNTIIDKEKDIFNQVPIVFTNDSVQDRIIKMLKNNNEFVKQGEIIALIEEK